LLLDALEDGIVCHHTAVIYQQSSSTHKHYW
jgi:hypothetical protein